MKIKEDLMLRKVCEEWVVIPMGARLMDFNGIMKLNESGAFIWKLLQEGSSRDEIIQQILNEYEIEESDAAKEVDDFITALRENHVLEEA